jgi:hypothetical protein
MEQARCLYQLPATVLPVLIEMQTLITEVLFLIYNYFQILPYQYRSLER